MKKIFIPLLFILFLAGCSSNQKVYTYSEPKSNLNNMTTPNQINQNLVNEYSRAILVTNLGSIEVEFYKESPITVSNFLTLAQSGFYNGTLFHRVIKDFMIQGGDPNSKNPDKSTHGMGGPDYKFADEFNDHKLVRGSLAMANAGANTNGSQFFIVTAESTPWLDGKHTNFGKVIKGMEVVEKIENVKVDVNDHPLEDIKIERIDLEKN